VDTRTTRARDLMSSCVVVSSDFRISCPPVARQEARSDVDGHKIRQAETGLEQEDRSSGELSWIQELQELLTSCPPVSSSARISGSPALLSHTKKLAATSTATTVGLSAAGEVRSSSSGQRSNVRTKTLRASSYR
jgi:phosphatidylserine decarboxylase